MGALGLRLQVELLLVQQAGGVVSWEMVILSGVVVLEVALQRVVPEVELGVALQWVVPEGEAGRTSRQETDMLWVLLTSWAGMGGGVSGKIGARLGNGALILYEVPQGRRSYLG